MSARLSKQRFTRPSAGWRSAAVVYDVVGGQGLLAAGRGFKKPIQFAFHQLECLFAAQHQSFHSVPTQVESVGVAEYVAKFHEFLYPTPQMGERTASLFPVASVMLSSNSLCHDSLPGIGSPSSKVTRLKMFSKPV